MKCRRTEVPSELLPEFEQIAKEHLLVETLKPRNRDSLDFHDCSVLGIQDALFAAYQMGRRSVSKRKTETAKEADDRQWMELTVRG